MTDAKTPISWGDKLRALTYLARDTLIVKRVDEFLTSLKLDDEAKKGKNHASVPLDTVLKFFGVEKIDDIYNTLKAECKKRGLYFYTDVEDKTVQFSWASSYPE